MKEGGQGIKLCALITIIIDRGLDMYVCFSQLQKCSDYKASSVKTFARTEPPDTQVTKSVIALLLHYNWDKFTILAEKPWFTVAHSLEDQANKHNLTVNHYRRVENSHSCCEQNLPCCGNQWFQILQETKNMTRSQSKFSYKHSSLSFRCIIRYFV